MFREFETVVPRKKREDLRYRWKLSSLLIFLADTETSISDWAEMKGVERWAEQVKPVHNLSRAPSSYMQIFPKIDQLSRHISRKEEVLWFSIKQLRMKGQMANFISI